VLSQAEETVRNALAFHYRDTHRAADDDVSPGLRALAKFQGKVRLIERSSPRGAGLHYPKLTQCDESPFGGAIRTVVKKLILGLEYIQGRLDGRQYVINSSAYAWDIPLLGFRRTFERAGFEIWPLHSGSYQWVTAQRFAGGISDYGLHVWGNLVIRGRLEYVA
jgi:hypothetical protein